MRNEKGTNINRLSPGFLIYFSEAPRPSSNLKLWNQKSQEYLDQGDPFAAMEVVFDQVEKELGRDAEVNGLSKDDKLKILGQELMQIGDFFRAQRHFRYAVDIYELGIAKLETASVWLPELDELKLKLYVLVEDPSVKKIPEIRKHYPGFTQITIAGFEEIIQAVQHTKLPAELAEAYEILGRFYQAKSFSKSLNYFFKALIFRERINRNNSRNDQLPVLNKLAEMLRDSSEDTLELIHQHIEIILANQKRTTRKRQTDLGKSFIDLADDFKKNDYFDDLSGFYRSGIEILDSQGARSRNFLLPALVHYAEHLQGKPERWNLVLELFSYAKKTCDLYPCSNQSKHASFQGFSKFYDFIAEARKDGNVDDLMWSIVQDLYLSYLDYVVTEKDQDIKTLTLASIESYDHYVEAGLLEKAVMLLEKVASVGLNSLDSKTKKEVFSRLAQGWKELKNSAKADYWKKIEAQESSSCLNHLKKKTQGEA